MTKLTAKDKRDEENQLLVQEFENLDPGNISYDYFKNMVSLSLVTLGGMLGLSDSLLAGKVTFGLLMIPCGPIALAGLIALQCQSDIVQIVRGRKEPTVYLRYGHRVVSGLLGLGVGAFLFVLSRAM
ncbi:MAG: hypothetical protein ACKO1O_04865 [Erythrobacter sp.]